MMQIRGLTDEALASKTGLTKMAIYRLRTQKSASPTLSSAKKIADCLKVSLDYLAGGELEIMSIRTKRKDVANLLHHLNSLSEEDIAFLSKMLMPYAQKRDRLIKSMEERKSGKNIPPKERREKKE